jgi:hypothetical protein
MFHPECDPTQFATSHILEYRYLFHGFFTRSGSLCHSRLWKPVCFQLLLQEAHFLSVLFLTFSPKYLTTCLATIVEPYFSSHPDRDIYVSLLQRTDPPASDSLLKSALVRRAMHDVQRVMRIREDKPALQNLLQKGSIGDDLWNSLLAAEKELEAEVLEVVGEANSFVEGWGGMIFQTANEMIANEKMRSLFEQTTRAREEKSMWSELKLILVLTCLLQCKGMT